MSPRTTGPVTAAVLAAFVLLGLVMTPPAAASPPDDTEDPGMPLLREAAAAARALAYTGVQHVVSWTPTGSSSALLRVVSSAGAPVTIRDLSAGPAGRDERVDPGSPGGGLSAPPEGMLAVLARNYRVVTAGRGAVAGRSCRIVQALRADGTVAARFCVDESSRLLLRREILDGSGRVTSAATFIELDVRHPAPHRPLRAVGQPVTGPDPRELARLRARGWVFGDRLPGRMELFRASDAEGSYLYLGYSDGLSVVSVFVQPGYLDEERLAGWHARTSGGRTIWVRGSARQEMIWASGGNVYTVVADAPADTVDAVVAALPHEREPDVWTRLARGASRLVSWVNPFA